jgi:myo-inositol 2-dehydrogenase/D-chiro-inositol 1-dehydrogenase
MSFKICSIGCGRHSSSVHGPAYKKYALLHPDVELSACCDIDEGKAKLFQTSFNFKRYYTDIDDMIKAEKPDAVCLVVKEHLTAKLAIKILSYGLPLITEKPPGNSLEEAWDIANEAKKSNAPNQVAFNRRFTPLVRVLKQQLLNNFENQKIQNIRYDFYRIGRKDTDFYTTAIHGIDTVKYLSGSEYESIRFDYQEFPELGQNVANIYMSCRFVSGTTAQLSFCPVSGVVLERATVNLLDNTFFLNIPMWAAYDVPGHLTHMFKGQTVMDVTGDEISDGDEMFEFCGFYAENESFFNDLRAGRKPKDDIFSALQSVEIADCIRDRLQEYNLKV